MGEYSKIFRVECSVCDKVVPSSRFEWVICSPCQQKIKQAKLEKKKRACIICGKRYVPWDKKQKYCSYKCTYKAQENHIITKCENCHRNVKVVQSSQRESGVYFCSSKCHYSYMRKHSKTERTNISTKRKKKMLEATDYRCPLCGTAHERLSPLHVHHINGNPADDRDKNLVIACCRCHRKAHFHKDINKELKNYNRRLNG